MRRFLPGGDSGRILANAGWLYFDQVLRAGIVLVTFSLMARGLGPERFGLLSYAVAFPGIFLPLAMLATSPFTFLGFTSIDASTSAAGTLPPLPSTRSS